MKQRLVLAAVLAAAAVPLPAHAQQWLADRRLTEGMGVRVGNLELHPAVGAEFGYDTNYFQLVNSRKKAAYRLRITPAFSVSTLGPERRQGTPGLPPAVAFRLGAHAAYNELWAAKSDDSDTFAEQRHIDGGATLSIDINPQRPFGVDIQADYERIGEPTSDESLVGLTGNDASFDRGSFRGGAGVTWRPGGGNFEWRLGYELGYNYFEAGNLTVDNNVQHSVVTRGRWRFLPRTALMYDAAYRFVRYTHPDDPQAPNDGDLVSTRVGLNGLVTARLSLLGLVGWSSSFYDGQGEDADTLQGQVEAKYFVIAPNTTETAATGLSTVALGFTRQIANSYLSSFYARNRGYLNATYFLGGVFVASAEGGFSYLQFPDGIQYEAFNQKRIDARLFAEYRLTNSIGANASLMFDRNISDRLTPRAGVAGTSDNLNYTRWQAYLGLRWFM